MKKILTALMASAFALTVYAPSAMACGGPDKKKVAKKEKKQDTKKKADKKKTADKDKSDQKKAGEQS